MCANIFLPIVYTWYILYTGEKEGIDCVVYVCYLLPKMLLLEKR